MRVCLLTLHLILLGIMGTLTMEAQTFRYRTPYGSLDNYYRDVAVLANGNYVCAGSFSDQATGNVGLAIGIIDPYGQPVRHISYLTSSSYAGYAVEATSDGGFIVGGQGRPPWTTSYCMLIKCNAQGDTIWTHNYPAFPDGPFTVTPSRIHDVKEVPAGGYIAVGQSTRAGFDMPLYIIRTDAQGNKVWDYLFSGPNQYEEGSYSIINTSDNGFLITGFTSSYTANFNQYYTVAIKLDANGNEEWTQHYFDEVAFYSYMRATEMANGNFVIGVTGYPVTSASGHVLVIDAVGDSVTSKYFNDLEQINDIISTSDGGCALTGYSTSQQHLFLLKLDDQLNEEWRQVYVDPNSYHEGYAVKQAPDGGYLVAGYWNTDALLLKTDPQGNASQHLLRGKVIADANANCTEDAGEPGIGGYLVQVNMGSNYYGYTNNNGEYAIQIFDTGNAIISWYNPNSPYWLSPACQGGNTSLHLAIFDTTDLDLFAEPVIDCPNLHVTVSNPFIRRCFGHNLYTITYCNYGTLPAAGSYIDVTLDPGLIVDSASTPWVTPQTGNTYRFDVGLLDVGDCGDFNIWVTVDCNNTVPGQSHCVEAHIYPDSICAPSGMPWDSSSLVLSADCLPGDTIQFKITNVGSGDMDNPQYFIIAEDNVMYLNGQFQLNAGDSYLEKVPGAGATYTMIVPQSPGHPGNSNPLKSIEGCGRDSMGNFSTGYLTRFPQDDLDPYIDILCKQNIASYDPNEKQVEPLGLEAEGYISEDQPLSYTIHFQNTGTDTAFTVILRDTLPTYIDITTLQLTGASHAYDFKILQSNILVWTFSNILLPDSNVNEPASHGYVSFHIRQKQGNTPGTQISNRAGIYFDYNPVVITNYTLNTVVEDYTDRIFITVNELTDPGNAVQLYPNPSQGFIYLELEQSITGDVQFELFDLAGQQVKQFYYSGSGPHVVGMQDMDMGVYLYRVQVNGQPQGSGKILLTR